MAKRKDYKDELKWNVEDLYASKEVFDKDFKYLESKLKDFKKFQNHILDNAESLYNLLELCEETDKILERVYIYAHIQNDQDTTATEYQTLFGSVSKLYESFSETTSFITPELLKSDWQTIEKYINELPKLKKYERTLKETFKFKKFTLSEKEEKILSSLSSVMASPDDIYGMLTDADMTFGSIKGEDDKDIELSEKSYRKLIESNNRKVRKEAFTKLFGRYKEFKNTYASLLSNEVNMHNKVAGIRGYDSALHASLYRNDIPVDVYHNLIDTVKKNIAPLSQFWKLKKEALNVEELHLYDTYATTLKGPSKSYTESEAKDLVLKSLEVLGSTYITDLKKAFDERWVDFIPNDGKRNGAYATACYSVHPYVLLNFTGTLNDVSTLAHELGHAMHYYYAIKNQSFNDYGYSIFVAEVASQVNQILLSKYLIKHTEDIEEKGYLIDDLICDFKASIYRQTMFADFELQIHELDQKGEILTHEKMCNLYYELNKEYFGENIIIDDLIQYEWMRIPHFYMNFYVYQYATAYAAAIKIAMDILNKKENATENYLAFLKLGCTKTPIESLKVAGVDMSSPKAIEEAFDYFNDLIKELEELKRCK